MSPATHDPEYDNWPVTGREDSDVAYVGTTSEDADDPTLGPAAAVGGQIFYDPNTSSLFGGTVDEDDQSIDPIPDAEWSVDPEETLGEAIERVGDETGWDSLSSFAEEHLEDDG